MDTEILNSTFAAATRDYHRRLEENRLDDVPVHRLPYGFWENITRPYNTPLVVALKGGAT